MTNKHGDLPIYDAMFRDPTAPFMVPYRDAEGNLLRYVECTWEKLALAIECGQVTVSDKLRRELASRFP